MPKGISRPNPQPLSGRCPVCGKLTLKLGFHVAEAHQTDLATARARKQRKYEGQSLTFLELKLQLLKAENEGLRAAGGATLPTPQERAEAVHEASLKTAAKLDRWNLSRAAQAGLPSLGKHR